MIFFTTIYVVCCVWRNVFNITFILVHDKYNFYYILITKSCISSCEIYYFLRLIIWKNSLTIKQYFRLLLLRGTYELW